jgi:hypothetical protein
LLASMHGHQSCLPIRSDDEVGDFHAGRLENVLVPS